MYRISIVLPTYNCARLLEQSLKSIEKQNYPKDLVEIIVVDGLSSDNTRDVAIQYGATVLDNKYTIHPKGRAIGIDHSSGDLILCIDSDNVLDGNDWLRKMTIPFDDPEIVAAEPIYYVADKRDNLITRYCAILGGDDPIVISLGYNERYSWLTGKWTNVMVNEKDMAGYLKVKFLDPFTIPSLGANGFMVKGEVLKKTKYDPFYHIDVCHQIIKRDGYWAKVKTGIKHNHGDSINKYISKKIRRAERRLDEKNDTGYIYSVNKMRQFCLFYKSVLVFPVLIDTLKAFIRRPSIIWLYHPLFYYLVLFVYAYTYIHRKIIQITDEEYEKIA